MVPFFSIENTSRMVQQKIRKLAISFINPQLNA